MCSDKNVHRFSKIWRSFSSKHHACSQGPPGQSTHAAGGKHNQRMSSLTVSLPPEERHCFYLCRTWGENINRHPPALPREFLCGASVVWLPVQQKVSSPASVCIKHEYNYVISLSSDLSGCSSSLQTSAWSIRSSEEREDVRAGSGCRASPHSPVHTVVSHTPSLSQLYWVGSSSVFHFSFLFPSQKRFEGATRC